MADTETTPQTAQQKPGDGAPKPTFPDPSLSIIEFGDNLGLLLAARTERDAANRRLALHKVAYVRLQEKGWGATAYPEIWVEQTKDGIFRAVEPKTGNILRFPSRRRYEVSFLSPEIFQCAIDCLKEKQSMPLYELVVVTFGTRDGFSVESGNLLGPDDYASERNLEPGRQWLPTPPLFS